MVREKTFIVVKCGNVKTHHAAKELDKVINKKGFAWFAKYGSKIKFDQIKLNDPYQEYILSLSLFFDNQYHLFHYQIEEFASKIDQVRGTFPDYYQEHFYFIGTWIKVTPYKGTTPTVNDLVIKSSLNKLGEVLKKSTSGHFLCRLLKN
jgi:hypothetical protein